MMKRIHAEYRELWARLGEHPKLRAFTVALVAAYLLTAAIGGMI